MMEKFRGFGIVGIIFLLMTSVASAGFLDYYGRIIGTADVSPPIFYASYENIAINWYKLLINQKSQQAGTIDFPDANNIMFWSESLDINSFYSATYTFYVKAGATSSTTLNVRLYIANQDGDWKQDICSSSISNVKEDNVYTTFCEGDELSLQSTDTLVWEVKGTGGPGITNYIYIDLSDSTRIEVAAA